MEPKHNILLTGSFRSAQKTKNTADLKEPMRQENIMAALRDIPDCGIHIKYILLIATLIHFSLRLILVYERRKDR